MCRFQARKNDKSSIIPIAIDLVGEGIRAIGTGIPLQRYQAGCRVNWKKGAAAYETLEALEDISLEELLDVDPLANGTGVCGGDYDD